ncbi:TPA: rod shape-determining protein, partial [Candidatus Beckwithbacteria bacterium]|nr:rod shape-determining protein [Candidatus Beckwithbacteria bacterium]
MIQKVGIDLGTANSVVYLAGSGIVLAEPTVVAVTVEDNRVVAVGNEAKEMLGRTPENIVASKPMRDGVIADYQVTEAMLRYFIREAAGKALVFKPEVMICV